MIAFLLIILFVAAGLFMVSLFTDKEQKQIKQSVAQAKAKSTFGQEIPQQDNSQRKIVNQSEDFHLVSWSIKGMDKNVLNANFSIQNGDFTIKKKRATIICDSLDKNETKIESKRKFVFLSITPNQIIQLKDVNMGTLRKGTPEHLSCRLTDKLESLREAPVELESIEKEILTEDMKDMPALPPIRGVKVKNSIKNAKSIDELEETPLPELR